jgi:hypothetical protein
LKNLCREGARHNLTIVEPRNGVTWRAQVDLYNFVNMDITNTRMKSKLWKDVINAI